MAGKKKNTGLGRGLDALFAEAGIGTDSDPGKTAAAGAGAEEISIDDIKPNAAQPRKVFDEEALDELAGSIQQHGLIQPIIVRSSGKAMR